MGLWGYFLKRLTEGENPLSERTVHSSGSPDIKPSETEVGLPFICSPFHILGYASTIRSIAANVVAIFC